MAFVASPDYWQVRIALDHEDWDKIRVAMFQVMPSERWVINLAPGDDGEETATLLLDVLATNHPGAEDEAESVFAKALIQAGLSSRAPQIIGVRTPLFGEEPYARLLKEARNLALSDRYEMAVIRAQTACELYAAVVLEVLTRPLRKDDESLAGLFRSFTLTERRDRAFLQSLTGSVPSDQEWWPEYRLHVKRRNAVVHEGLSVLPDEAHRSLKAAQEFISYLGWLWEGQPDDRFARS